MDDASEAAHGHGKRLLRQVRSATPRKRGEKMVRAFADLEDPDRVARGLLARLKEWAEFRAPFEEEWRFAIRAWLQLPTEEREDSWESDRYMPVILKHVETALPSIIAATLDQHGIFRLHGMTRKNKERARALQALVNWQAQYSSGAEEAYEDMYWWAALCGTAFVEHFWDYREVEAQVPERGKFHETNGETETRMILEADTPRVECLNPFDVYASPRGKVGPDCPAFILRVETTARELRELAENGAHIDRKALETWLREARPHKIGLSERSWFDDVAGLSFHDVMVEAGYEDESLEESHADQVDEDRTLVVLRYVSDVETITMGGPKHLIGYSANPHRHRKTGIVIHQFYKIPGCPYGRGLGCILRGHQSLANENINAWMDTVNLERMAPVEVDRTRLSLTDEDLVLQPNAVIESRGGGAVNRIDVPAPTNLAMAVDAHLARDADDLTGFTEQARGLAPGVNQTATQYQGIQSSIRTRLVTHVRRSSRTLRASGLLLVSLNQQFFDREQVVQVTGEDGLEYVDIQPDELERGDVMVGVSISTSRASPDARAQRLLQLLAAIVPLIQSGMLHLSPVRRLVRMVLEANEVEDVDLILPRGDRNKDALVENELLREMIAVPVVPTEPHDLHLKHHQPLLNELIEAGAPEAVLQVVKDHIQDHFEAVAMVAAAQGQALQQAQGAPQAGMGPGDGSPTRQEANLAGQATGGQGMAGMAAPGPAAPGRLA